MSVIIKIYLTFKKERLHLLVTASWITAGGVSPSFERMSETELVHWCVVMEVFGKNENPVLKEHMLVCM